MSNEDSLFIKNLIRISEISDKNITTESYEEDLVNVICQIKANPDKVDFYKEVIKGLINQGTYLDFIPIELIQFILRYFRWSDIKEYLICCRDNSNEIRKIKVLNTILEVYDDFWEDFDLFSFYIDREGKTS